MSIRNRLGGASAAGKRRRVRTVAGRLLAALPIALAIALVLAGQPMAGERQSADPADRLPIATISIAMTPVAAISPYLYGINYDWNKVPAERFAGWNRALSSVAHYTLAHYPGGWNPEHFDWAANREPTWRNVNGNGYDGIADHPGVDPDTFLAAVPQADFVTPSLPAIADPGRIPEVVAISRELVRRYGDRVKIWDIGNEWWLQRGGKRRPAIRAENLNRYAALVRAVVPAMKAADPSVHVYAGADWQDPEEFRALRRLVGPAAWAQLDGVSVHTYCNGVEPTCGSIPGAADLIRTITGKDKIFDSQWFVTRRRVPDNFGIRNANYLVLAFQDLAFARMQGAIIWPVTDFIPELNFVAPDYSAPYASGVLFGWMAEYYEGQALRAAGDLPAVAAKSARGVTVFVPSESSGPRRVRVRLAGAGLGRVVSAQALYSPDPDDRVRSRVPLVASLPTSLSRELDGAAVDFTVNPGGPGRGSSWEIVRVTLQ